MKQIYAFERKEEFLKYQDVIQRFVEKLSEYRIILEQQYGLTELPKGILWTNEELATKVFSNIPIPAFTNKDLIYMSPDVESWRKLLLRQLDEKELPDVQKFYESFSENQIFIILAHELTHHSDLFIDEFDDARENSIWFEEGMCFYLPRKLLLSDQEFNEITNAEIQLCEAFKGKYGKHSLEDFGASSYRGSLSSIMFDYWRSYLSVRYLVEVHANNNVIQVFDTYHNWDREGRKVPLTEYFEISPLGCL